MEHDHDDPPSDDAEGEVKFAGLTCRRKEGSSQQCCPESVSHRGEHSSDELGLDHRKDVCFVGCNERIEGVARCLKCCEPKANTRAEHHPVAQVVRRETARQPPDDRDLDGLFDDGDTRQPQDPRNVVERHRLNERGERDSEQPADAERSD